MSPRVFQFYHVSDTEKQTLYTATMTKNNCLVVWTKGRFSPNGGRLNYPPKEVNQLILDGQWVIVHNTNKEAAHLLRRD